MQSVIKGRENMSVLKTLLIGTFALIGGCTVVVGGCTYGVTKASIEGLGTIAETSGKNNFAKLYNESPTRAKKKYTEVASECYAQTMRMGLKYDAPKFAIDERVRFDIYEFQIRKTGDQKNIKYLPAWRDQSNKKILQSISDKKQRRAMKKYFAGVQKGNLLETLCISNGLTPETKTRPTVRKASYRK